MYCKDALLSPCGTYSNSNYSQGRTVVRSRHPREVNCCQRRYAMKVEARGTESRGSLLTRQRNAPLIFVSLSRVLKVRESSREAHSPPLFRAAPRSCPRTVAGLKPSKTLVAAGLGYSEGLSDSSCLLLNVSRPITAPLVFFSRELVCSRTNAPRVDDFIGRCIYGVSTRLHNAHRCMSPTEL